MVTPPRVAILVFNVQNPLCGFLRTKKPFCTPQDFQFVVKCFSVAIAFSAYSGVSKEIGLLNGHQAVTRGKRRDVLGLLREG